MQSINVKFHHTAVVTYSYVPKSSDDVKDFPSLQMLSCKLCRRVLQPSVVPLFLICDWRGSYNTFDAMLND